MTKNNANNLSSLSWLTLAFNYILMLYCLHIQKIMLTKFKEKVLSCCRLPVCYNSDCTYRIYTNVLFKVIRTINNQNKKKHTFINFGISPESCIL